MGGQVSECSNGWPTSSAGMPSSSPHTLPCATKVHCLVPQKCICYEPKPHRDLLLPRVLALAAHVYTAFRYVTFHTDYSAELCSHLVPTASFAHRN